MRIKSPQDFGAAILLAIIGFGGLWYGRELDVGRFADMGPGYLPMVLSWSLLGFAAIIFVRAFVNGGPPVEKVVLRAVVLVIAAIVLFALLIETAGFAVTVLTVTFVAALGSREVRWKEAAGLGIVLAVFSVLVFVYALRQPLPVWWWSS